MIPQLSKDGKGAFAIQVVVHVVMIVVDGGWELEVSRFRVVFVDAVVLVLILIRYGGWGECEDRISRAWANGKLTRRSLYPAEKTRFRQLGSSRSSSSSSSCTQNGQCSHFLVRVLMK